MNMLPQPPPDAPPPPPSEAALLSQKKWSRLKVAGITSLFLILLAALTAPLIFRSRKRAEQVQAINNLRQIGLALYEFKQEYGSYPNEETIAKVKAATGTELEMDPKSSNGFFRQLVGSGIASSEVMFFAEGKGVMMADNVSTTGRALEKGECGFSYFLGAKQDNNPSRPLVVAPMIPGTDRFDPKPFRGFAVIFSPRGIKSCRIDKDGHAIFEDRNLMDPAHPVWDGHPPIIAWPDL